MTVGETGDGIRLVGGRIDGFAQALTLGACRTRTTTIKLPLVGGFQVAQCAGRGGLCIATGARAGARVRRARHARRRQGPARTRRRSATARPIFIDYAHKPDALEKALEALRP